MEESLNYSSDSDPATMTNFSLIGDGGDTTSQKTPLYSPSRSVVILLYALYGGICLLALVGNAVVLWLILGSKRMRTVTNMFIANLAFADVVMAVFIIPFHFQAALYQRWVLPECLCPICPSVQILSVTVSVFTLSAIAMHRYRGIMKPLSVPISKGSASRTLFVMWMTCILIASPTYFDYTIIYYMKENGTITVYCQNVELPDTFRRYYQRFVVLVQYFLPLLIISVTYCRMGRQLWRNQTPGNEERSRDTILLNMKKKVTRMLAVMVILFGVCWLPFQTFNFLVTYFPSIEFPYINMIWFSIHWLAMSNSCCNPFIYGIYNGKFREEFRNRVACKFFRKVRLDVEVMEINS